MCFSADADFVSGAVIGVIGLATLAKVEKPTEIPLAVLPLALALHQVVEGFVWQNLDHGSTRVGGVAVYLYVSFAWVVLPVLAPSKVTTDFNLLIFDADVIASELRANRQQWRAALIGEYRRVRLYRLD